MKRFVLSRRVVLKGAGAAIGLPVLEAMIDVPRAQAAGRPLCLITFFIPNGVHDSKLWKPTTTGPGYALPDWMKPLEPHREGMTLISGSGKMEAYLNQTITTDAHIRGCATFATGAGITKSGAGGISVDQVIANHIGGDSPIRSLPVALGRLRDPRQTCISWAGANQPVPAERDPALLFGRLFGNAPAAGGAADDRRARYRRSVLDFVKGDASRLHAKLGVPDRHRLDAHLTGIREMERMVAADRVAVACAAPSAPGATPELSNARAQLLMRLMVSAIACGRTRVASFQLAGRPDNRVFSWLGVTEGHHTISHYTDAAGRAKRLKLLIDQVEQLAFLLQLLKDTKEANGTLWDRTVVFHANEHGDNPTDSHYFGDMPVLIAGGGNGRYRAGLHLKATPRPGESRSQYSNILVALLKMFDVPASTFGVNGTAPMDGVLT